MQRSKGLGENEPDMMWLTTMNPETRRLIKVMPEDVERTAQVFDLLLGDDLQGRKSHIADNGYKYLELADILCIFFLLLGIILYRTDAAIQALCYFKNGGIYLVKNGRRLADDTPEDRRRLARWLGRFVIGLSCLMFLFLLLLYFT